MFTRMATHEVRACEILVKVRAYILHSGCEIFKEKIAGCALSTDRHIHGCSSFNSRPANLSRREQERQLLLLLQSRTHLFQGTS